MQGEAKSSSSAALLAGFASAHVLAVPLRPSPSRDTSAHTPFLFWLAGQVLPRCTVDVAAPEANYGMAVGQALAALAATGRVLLGAPPANPVPPALADRFQLLPQPPETALQRHAEGSVDLLLLDGGCGADAFDVFQAWRPKLSARAVVVLAGTRAVTGEGEVGRLFLSLSATLPAFELTEGGGLGLVLVGTDTTRDLAALLSLPGAPADEGTIQQVRAFCGQVGALAWDAARKVAEEEAAPALSADGLSVRLDALADELERERRAGASMVRKLQDTAVATSERHAQQIADLIDKLTATDRDLSGALAQLRSVAPQAARAAELEQELADERLRMASLVRDHAAALADVERRHAAYAGALSDHAASARADLSVERLRAQRLSEQVAGAERRLNRLREDMAELSRRLEATALDVEVERARRRSLAALAAGPYIAARRGLRGVIGLILRRCWPGELAQRCRILSDSGLFDRDFYVREYPEAGGRRVEPVVDFLIRGGFEGCRPNPVFDSAFYLNTYPDVRAAGLNPLWHYALYGEAEGRLPSRLFDPAEYRAAHPGLPPDQSALADYLATHFPSEAGAARRRTLGVRVRRALRWLGRPLRYGSKSRLPASQAAGGKGEARFVAFRPAPDRPGGDLLTSVEAGSYAWSAQNPGYTYIAPRRPRDVEAQVAALECPPRFSILVPLYNTPPTLLNAMIRSVQTQWYPHWELVLVDDKSPDPQVRAALEEIEDPRIKIRLSDRNQGISGATNEALAMASGDYVVFLDHDDELTEDCLYELALCIDREGADFIYSDEDKISTDGRLVDPFFKPDWSPDMLMSLMYTCHVSCVRRTLALEVGGLRPDYDGSQDWDFVLRVTERTTRIAHVAKVLYHWRMIPGSTAATFDAKPQALDAAVRLRQDALKRRGLQGDCEAVKDLPAYQRVRYHVTGNPKVSIIIPSKNNGATLRNCITSIHERSSYRNVEVVVVDNGSSVPDTLTYLEEVALTAGSRVVRHDAPFNFSELCNVGARAATGDFLLFLNDDTEVITPDWLERMLGYGQLQHVGAVGAKLLYPQTLRVQHAGVICIADGPSHAFLGANGDDPCYYARNLLESNWLAVTGACLLVERLKFDRIGGFDETFPVAYNDVELCYRLVEAGYFNVVCPAAQLLHYESMSRGLDHQSGEKIARLRADKRRLDARHPRFFMSDPFFSPNLHPNDVMFSIPA